MDHLAKAMRQWDDVVQSCELLNSNEAFDPVYWPLDMRWSYSFFLREKSDPDVFHISGSNFLVLRRSYYIEYTTGL